MPILLLCICNILDSTLILYTILILYGTLKTLPLLIPSYIIIILPLIIKQLSFIEQLQCAKK